MSTQPHAELPEYVLDTGTPGSIPEALTGDSRHQFVPINDKKESAVKWAGGSRCLSFQELMDGWFGSNAADWWTRGYQSVGVRLELSGLVVIDCDVVMARYQGMDVEPGYGDDTRVRYMHWPYHDGRLELRHWLRKHDLKLPPTLTLKTAGREDGFHLPGWHLYYRQNPEWKVLPGQLTPHVEVKANGICRYTQDFEVMRDGEIETLPLALAKALTTPTMLATRRPSGGSGPGSGGLAELAVQGENHALMKLKGFMVGTGIWTEEQANEVVKFADNVLDDPMGEARLRDTVLRPKGWDQ